MQCKTVITKLQKKIEKGGHQIIPLLHGLWKRIGSSGCMGGSEDSPFGLQTIDLRVDESEYSGVLEFVSDVQLMLKGAVQYFGFSHEVCTDSAHCYIVIIGHVFIFIFISPTLPWQKRHTTASLNPTSTLVFLMFTKSLNKNYV